MTKATAARIAGAVGNRVADFCAVLAAAALLIIVGICSINVLRRYLFGGAWSWAEEAMVYLMILVVFAGAVKVTWRSTHVRINFIVDCLPRAMRSAVAVLITTTTVGTLATMSYFSYQVVQMLYSFEQKTDGLEMPMWIPQGLVATAFGLFALLSALRLYVPPTDRGETELDIAAKEEL